MAADRAAPRAGGSLAVVPLVRAADRGPGQPHPHHGDHPGPRGARLADPPVPSRDPPGSTWRGSPAARHDHDAASADGQPPAARCPLCSGPLRLAARRSCGRRSAGSRWSGSSTDQARTSCRRGPGCGPSCGCSSSRSPSRCASAAPRSGSRRRSRRAPGRVARGGSSSSRTAPTPSSLRRPPGRRSTCPARFVSFIGTLARWQGINTVIDALGRPAWPADVALVVVGDGVMAETRPRARPPTTLGSSTWAGSTTTRSAGSSPAGSAASRRWSSRAAA